MSSEKQSGGCLCGAVRFETSNQPVRAMACHCTACKKRTGAAYGVGVYFKDEDVEITQGELKTYQFNSDTSERWIKGEHCVVCGTTVTWTLEMRPGLRAISGGLFDNPDCYAIAAHIWTQSAREDACYPENMTVCEKALG